MNEPIPSMSAVEAAMEAEIVRLREALAAVLPYVNAIHFSGPELVRASAAAEAARIVLEES